MPYTKHIRAITRVQSYLDELLLSRTSIEYTTDDPITLRHYLYEATSYAKGHANPDIIKFAELRSKYVFKIKNGKLMCELRDQPFSANVISKAIGDIIVVHSPRDELDVIGFMIEHPKVERVQFPNLPNHDYDLETLETWCVNNKYKVEVLLSGVEVKKNA